MTPSDPNRIPDDLRDVAELLTGNRPEATGLELDGVKRQVLSRVRKGRHTMKSRIAMMAMLVVGLLMSGTGAGLAVSGLSSSGDASIAQYGKPNAVPCDLNGDGVADATEDLNGPAPGCAGQDVLPTTTGGGDSCDTNGDGVISPSEALQNGCGGVRGQTDEGSVPREPASSPNADRESGAQTTRQVEASGGDELPFTGFAAIPILIGGIALLSGGLVLRRRTSE